MKLTEQQKTNLQWLVKHQGFQVVELIVAEYETNVLKWLKSINLSNTDELAKLNASQNYLKGLEDCLSTIKGNSQAITKRKI